MFIILTPVYPVSWNTGHMCMSIHDTWHNILAFHINGFINLNTCIDKASPSGNDLSCFRVNYDIVVRFEILYPVVINCCICIVNCSHNNFSFYVWQSLVKRFRNELSGYELRILFQCCKFLIQSTKSLISRNSNIIYHRVR